MHKLLAGFLILAAAVTAQDPQWERVKAIRPGEVIWVRHLEGTSVVEDQARMMSCQDDGLAVRMGKKEVVWARSDIRSVRVYAGKSHARGALWGSLIGLAPGLGLGGLCARLVDESSVAPACIGIWGGIGGAIGTAVGAAVGTTIKQNVYRSK